ncbi:signal recognition particle-docking protein FtsY [Candidatus Epulonipiscioides saccharophilum]|nr:signal recognition particle-docking protein FtsY [Epulopiscium sp. SCG-B10WGA-EpuloB]
MEQSDDKNSTPEFYVESEIEYKDLTEVDRPADFEKNDEDYYEEIENPEDEHDQNPVVYFEGELVDSNFLTEEENLEEQANRELSVGIFKKLWQGLTKTRENILSGVENVLKSFKKIDDDLYEELEEVLIMADFGLETTDMILNELREVVKVSKITDPTDLKEALKDIITNILNSTDQTKPFIEDGKPNVILIVGVNGAGKTTSVAKLAHLFKEEGKTILLAAADTFRAAAIEQLGIWADRAGVDMIKNKEGTDPASVVYDAISSARARKSDILICDTAGRLQNKVNLMKELEKIGRIIDKEYSNAHKQVILVLDATTGQNAISQVKLFNEVVKIDGIILTKLDGTAKGGAIVGICQTLNVPVKFIGVGEKMDDLQKFNPEEFAKALFSSEE